MRWMKFKLNTYPRDSRMNSNALSGVIWRKEAVMLLNHASRSFRAQPGEESAFVVDGSDLD